MLQRLAKYDAFIKKNSIHTLGELWPDVYKRIRSVTNLLPEEVIESSTAIDS